MDIFHAKGHLFEVAKALYGPGSEDGEHWAKQQRDALDEGRIDDVIGALRRHADTCEAARKDAEYFSTNRERMNYPKFRAMGLGVATGVVEGGCKHIIGTRLKRGGMRWEGKFVLIFASGSGLWGPGLFGFSGLRFGVSGGIGGHRVVRWRGAWW